MTPPRVFPGWLSAFPDFSWYGTNATLALMAPRTPFSRPPVVLAVSVAGTWLRQALASLLKPHGYRGQFVASGRELLERAAAVRPDIVVLDTDLPDLDAVSVCRALRQNRAAWDMPVMMITSLSATQGQRRAARLCGARHRAGA